MQLPPSGVSYGFRDLGMTPREEDVFMLPRGVGPHLRPKMESSGVVWGRPPEPALAVEALLLVA